MKGEFLMALCTSCGKSAYNRARHRSGCASCSTCGSARVTRSCGCNSCASRSGCSSCGSVCRNNCSSCGSTGCNICGNCSSRGCSSCGCTGSGSGCNVCSSCESNGYGVLNGFVRRFPFYTGPCPDAPCDGCGCDDGCTSCNNTYANRNACGCDDGCTSCNGTYANRNACGCDDGCTSCSHARSNRTGGHSACPGNGIYATFSANGPLSLAAGSAVAMTMRSGDVDRFTVSGESIVLEESGVYSAMLTMDVPPDTVVDATVSLELNGQPLTPPRLAVTTSTTDGTTEHFAGNGVFRADAGSVLQVTANDAMTVHCAASQPVFILVLIRLA